MMRAGKDYVAKPLRAGDELRLGGEVWVIQAVVDAGSKRDGVRKKPRGR